MATSNVDAIAKFIGKYDKKLIGQALNSLDFVDQVRTIRNASLNGMLLPKMTVNKGIRPLNLDVNKPAGANRNFSGRKLFVYAGMKIISMVPEELYNSFASDMLVPGAKTIPFAQWVWEQEMKKIASEINDNIYLSEENGNATDYSAAATYSVGDYITYGTSELIYKCVSATTAGQNPDTNPAKWTEVTDMVICTGWGKIIADEITASNITPISTGAVSSSNALAKFEQMVKDQTAAHRKLGGVILCGPDQYQNYIDNERTVYGPVATPNMGTGKKTIYGHPNWSVEMATWMGSSNRLIATQRENLVFGCNMESDMNKVSKTVETLHGSDSVVKWVMGCEISDLETLYVNDQA